jgi:hypothetical protein
MIFRSIVFYALASLTAISASAQTRDSTAIKADTVKQSRSTEPVKDSTRLAIEAMPRKAAIRSAVLPGLGQYYNKGVWWIKVPVIYGGFVAFGLAIDFNQTRYKVFLREAQYRELNGKPLNPLYTEYTNEGIITIKDGYRRNRDLSILGAFGVYALNILEAYVDAKFFRFDIKDDLSLNITPAVQSQPVGYAAFNPVPVLKLSLSL